MATSIATMGRQPQVQRDAAAPVQGFNAIRWVDPLSGEDKVLRDYHGATEYRQWVAAGRPDIGQFFAGNPRAAAYSDQFADIDRSITESSSGYTRHDLAAQGINSNFTGSEGIRALTAQEASAQGLDPRGQYLAVHQTDPRATGSGNRTQAMVVYQRQPDGSAIPIRASDGFQGADPSASNRQLGMMFAGAAGFTALGPTMAGGSAAEGGAAASSAGANTGAQSAFRASEIAAMNAGGAGAGGAAIAPAGVNLVNAGGVMSTGVAPAGAGLGTSGVDAFRAGEIASSNAGGAGAPIAPNGVNLTNAGGVMSTGAGPASTSGLTLDDIQRGARAANSITRGIATMTGQGEAAGGAGGRPAFVVPRDDTRFDAPDLQAIYGMSSRALKEPASGGGNPSHPIDQNGLHIAAVQEVTKRVQAAKAKLETMRTAP